MRTCIRCGNIVSDDETFCARCGNDKFKEIKPMNAPTSTRTGSIGSLTDDTIREIPKQYVGIAPKQSPSERRQVRKNSLGNMQERIPNQQAQQMSIQSHQVGAVNKSVTADNREYLSDEACEELELKGFKKLFYLFSKQGNDGSSIKDWLITLLILCIPVYNIIYMIKNIDDNDIPNYKRTLFTTLLGFTGFMLVLGLIIGIIAIVV